MSTLLLRGTTVTDCNRARRADILLRDGRIEAVGEGLAADGPVLEAPGLVTLPSFVDLHAHFRDPGLTHKEDVETGCRAAVHGGYGAVNLMPNTKPVCSRMETVEYVQRKAAALNLCQVFQTASITENFDGKTLHHIEKLRGVRWLTDDGFGVDDTATILAAMRLAKERGMGLMLHEEDSALSATSMYLAEETMTARDVELAVLTGCATHFCHVSTRRAMESILDGKARCNSITCEVTPHHLALNDSCDGGVNPPLRGEEHRLFLIDCVKKGLVDAIATDHAPHTGEEKAAGARGFTGLDLSFATCYTALVRGGHIGLPALSRLLSAGPAGLLGLEGGFIEPGRPADLVLVDLEKSYTVTEEHIHSRSKNSPLLGRTLWGEVVTTIKGGRIVYERKDH